MGASNVRQAGLPYFSEYRDRERSFQFPNHSMESVSHCLCCGGVRIRSSFRELWDGWHSRVALRHLQIQHLPILGYNPRALGISVPEPGWNPGFVLCVRDWAALCFQPLLLAVLYQRRQCTVLTLRRGTMHADVDVGISCGAGCARGNDLQLQWGAGIRNGHL